MAEDKTISKSTGVVVNGATYYPMPGATIAAVDGCTGVGEGQPCPDEPIHTCVCKGGHKVYTPDALIAMGFTFVD